MKFLAIQASRIPSNSTDSCSYSRLTHFDVDSVSLTPDRLPACDYFVPFAYTREWRRYHRWTWRSLHPYRTANRRQTREHPKGLMTTIDTGATIEGGNGISAVPFIDLICVTNSCAQAANLIFSFIHQKASVSDKHFT